MNYYVYKITNLVNGKFYIGKCENRPIQQRFKEHKYLARCGEYKNSHLYEAVNKYGEDNFVIECICEYPDAESCRQGEKHLIDFLNAKDPKVGYNLADGGTGGNTHTQYKGQPANHLQTDEEKRKRSESLKLAYAEGRKRSMKGDHWKVSKPRTPEMNAANSARQKGLFFVYNPTTGHETKIHPDQADEYVNLGYLLHKRAPGNYKAWNKSK